MADASPPPTITFLTRPGCHLCDDAREELAVMLAERGASGLAVPAIDEVNIETDPGLLERYLETIPVLLVGADALPLAMRPGAIRRFLDHVLDGTPA